MTALALLLVLCAGLLLAAAWWLLNRAEETYSAAELVLDEARTERLAAQHAANLAAKWRD